MMNIKPFAIAMVLAVAAAGCGKKEEAGTDTASPGNEQAAQPAAGVVEEVEEAATQSADVIEGNVESIEANVEKGQDQSTVTPEQFEQSEKFPKEPAAAPETAEPPTGAGAVVEEEVDVVEEKPAQ